MYNVSMLILLVSLVTSGIHYRYTAGDVLPHPPSLHHQLSQDYQRTEGVIQRERQAPPSTTLYLPLMNKKCVLYMKQELINICTCELLNYNCMIILLPICTYPSCTIAHTLSQTFNLRTKGLLSQWISVYLFVHLL